jgi:hypothetical protein
MMPAIASTLVLVPVDNKPFIAQVQECKPKDKSWKCPAETPAWVTTLITEGVKMSLTSLTVQAGRHFSDRVNRAIFKSDITKRQAASAIAWTLISMVRPSVADDKLEVVAGRQGHQAPLFRNSGRWSGT